MMTQYLRDILLYTLNEILFVVLPPIFMGFILHHVSDYFRNRFAAVLGEKFYVYLTAVGVMVHEIGHAFFALIFGHKVKKIVLFHPREDRLGYVQHARNPGNLYHRIGDFFIGVGPLIFGPIVVYLLAILLLGKDWLPSISGAVFGNSPTTFNGLLQFFEQDIAVVVNSIVTIVAHSSLKDYKLWLLIYFVFAIGSHVTLSKEDIKGAAGGFLIFILTIFIFNLAVGWWHSVVSFMYLWLFRAGAFVIVLMMFALVLNGIISSVILILASSIRKM